MVFTIFTCVISCSLNIYCCAPHEQVTEIVEPQHNATSAVIMLHGAGESGPVMKEIIESHIGCLSQFPNTRFIFPTASTLPFYPFPWLGQVVNVWYTADSLSLDLAEDIDSRDSSAAQIIKWVEEQEAVGIPRNRICIVGYSAGGFMSLQLGYHYLKGLACVGSISSFISTKSEIYKKLTGDLNEIEKDLPPLYMASGSLDFVIYPSYTESTVEAFRAAGVQVTYDSLPGQTHLLTKEALEELFQFILEIFS